LATEGEVLGVEGVGSVGGEGGGDERVVAPLGGEFAGVGGTAVGFGGVGRGEVEDALAEDAADADFFGGAGDLVLEVIHVDGRGGAAFDHFDESEEGAPVDELAVDEVFLERENEAAEAVRDIVAEAAEDGHGRVRVGIDHAGDDKVAVGIDCLGRGVAGGERGGADCEDAGTADDDGAVFDDLAGGVHGDDVRVGDDEIGGLERGSGGHGLGGGERGGGEGK